MIYNFSTLCAVTIVKRLPSIATPTCQAQRLEEEKCESGVLESREFRLGSSRIARSCYSQRKVLQNFCLHQCAVDTERKIESSNPGASSQLRGKGNHSDRSD